MSKGFVQSGKLGPIGGRSLGAIPISPSLVSTYDTCPAGYSRDITGVCVLNPVQIYPTPVFYTPPVVMAGRRR